MSKFYLLITLSAVSVWGQSVCSQYVAQTANVSPCINNLPSREFGQPALQTSLNSIAPNLVEGRELNQPNAVAFDTSVSPPIFYIVDSSNNRVLGYKNPYSVGVCGLNNPTCGFANLAIGPLPTDFQTTLPGGPNGATGINTGLSFPTSAVVDSNGNLYVLDAGNNRILRFPAPFKQTSSVLQVDLVIGQKNFNSGTSPNQGQPLPSAQSLYFSSGGTLYNSALTIEPSTGALWVTDPGNNRVLRFPASQLAPNTALPTADLVVGQTTFTSGSVPATPPNTYSQMVTTTLYQPAGITFDSKDRLYVSDGVQSQFYRVMVFVPGFGIGMSATRILGLDFPLSNSNTPITYPNNYALIDAVGLFTTGENLWVCDAGQNRIVEYDVFENWPAPGTVVPNQPITAQVSPPMLRVLGQTSFTSSSMANQGLAQPTNATFYGAYGAAVNGTDIWVADTYNSRVLDFPQQSGGVYTTASGLVGQLAFSYNAPNLIEGREVNFVSGAAAGATIENVPLGGAGVAVDHNSNPPHLYVADTANNRILCFKSVYTVGFNNAVQADMVIGQNGPTDYYDWQYNSPTNLQGSMSQTGLFLPTDVLVDPQGNLWVADLGNSRVLRFPPPFSQPAGTQIQPNLVLGQFSFTGTPQTTASPETMSAPFGLAMFSNGAIAVSDAGLNRVLIFTKPSGGDFQNSQSAAIVLGQQNFTNTGASNSAAGLYSPRHIAVDTSDRLYVADAGNGRMVVWDGANSAGNGAASNLSIAAFNQPQGIKVSKITGEIWIADSQNNRLLRLPEYDTLIVSSTPTSFTVTNPIIPTQTGPLAIELDDVDNIVIAEAANRVSLYYAALAWQNPANFNSEPLAPGMLALLYRWGLNFNAGTQTDYTPAGPNPVPLPKSFGNIQVTVDGIPAPIYLLAGGAYPYIGFQVPSEAPSSGNANIVVTNTSNNEILGTISAPMAPYNPGFFTSNSEGTGLAAATNTDGSINSAGNPVKAGGKTNGNPNFITFYLTGGGAFPGVADGYLPSSPVNTTVAPQILSADGCGGLCPASDVAYSGSSFYPGEWQINFVVTSVFAPGQHVIVVTMNGTPSNIGSSNQPASIQVSFYSN